MSVGFTIQCQKNKEETVQIDLRLLKFYLSIKTHIFFLYKIIFYFYFWLRWVFVAALVLSLVAASGGYSSCSARASHCGGFSCCGARALGVRASVVVARGLSSYGSWALERRLSSCGAWA